MQYKQVKQKISTQKETILESENSLSLCQSELMEEKNNQNDLNLKLADLQETITENEAAIDRLKNKVASSPEETLSIKSQINRLNYYETELLDSKKKMLTQIELSKNKLSGKLSEFTRRQRKVDHEKKIA